MDKYYDFDYEPLSLDDVEEEVTELFNTLLDLYTELFDVYNDLRITLNEIETLEGVNLNQYVVAQCKLDYFKKVLPNYFDIEKNLYHDNDEILSFFAQYIKKRFKLEEVCDVDIFSPIDTMIYKDYESIKDNYPVIRMLRAIRYYKIYNDIHFAVTNLNTNTSSSNNIVNYTYTDEDIRNSIIGDFVDNEALSTITQLYNTFYTDDIEFINRYKCLLMYSNPYIERLYFLNDFDDVFYYKDVNEYKDAEMLQPFIKIIKSRTVNALLTINNNKVINRSRGRLIKEPESEDPKVLEEFNKNRDEVRFLQAFLLQSYSYFSLDSVKDFDHLFSVMCKKNIKGYDSIKLSPKVVNYFFRKNAYNNPNFEKYANSDESNNENGKQRKRDDN